MGVSGKETGEKEGNRDGKKEQMGLGEGKIKGLERRAIDRGLERRLEIGCRSSHFQYYLT
jgi:hypothetical protein